jgi:predicted dehydrogenase
MKFNDISVLVVGAGSIGRRHLRNLHAAGVVQRGCHCSCKISGERGNLLWDFAANEVRLYRVDDGKWTSFPYQFEPNDMYVAEVKSFLETVATGGQPAVTIEEAARVLEVALTAKRAASAQAAGRT